LDIFIALQSILQATMRMATPLIYPSIGELIEERAGLINIGLEGLMLIGAVTAYIVAFFTGSSLLGVFIAAIITGLFGGMFGFITINLKANQIVTGTAFNLFGLGLTSFVFRVLFSDVIKGQVKSLQITRIPILSEIPFFGPIFFQHNLLVYAAFGLVLFAVWVLNKTMIGVSLRAVGEHPRAVTTAGLSVTRLRYGATIFMGMMAGIGGAYLPVVQGNIFVENMVAGRGFIALVIVVFGRWKPSGVLLASLLFGFTYALQLRLQAQDLQVPYQLLQTLPYLVTILVMIFFKGYSVQPKSLGVPYGGDS